MLSRRNYNIHWLYKWYSASCKYTYPSQIPTTSQQQVTRGIGLHVNANKTEYMCFKREWAISILNGGSLKLVDKFRYLGSVVSSSESDDNMRLAKAWTAIDWLPIIRKSELSDKIKRYFFQTVVVSILLNRCTTLTLTKRIKKKFDRNYAKLLRVTLNTTYFWT